MTNDTAKLILGTLERHAKDIKAAYYGGMKGVEYEDMKAAVVRLLEMRQGFERASGRKVKTRITAQTIANTLRAL